MISQIVVVQKDVLVVDSRLIASNLGVNHSDWMRNVVKKYQSEIEQEFGHLRFENGTVSNSVGAVNLILFCWLTEDQSYFLTTLSRNSPQVIKCKANLVKAFSDARKPVVQTPAEMILAMAQQLVDIERQQRELQHSVTLLAENQKQTCDRVEILEHEQDRFNSPCGHKYTVLGYAKRLGLDLSLATASSKGRKASSLCRSLGIEIESVNDPRFGLVGLYPQTILVQVFGEGL